MGIPVYQQIINSLSDKIRLGKYEADAKLPSEKELMEMFSTSRITVTRALQDMESKGIIYRLKGKGSFVAPTEKKDEPASRIISLVLPHKEDFFSGGQQYSRQIYKICQKHGYLCSIHYSENSSGKEKKILEEIEHHNVAGAIIYPISNRNIDTLSRMNIKGFPIVLLDRRLQELNLPAVISDNFCGAFDAVNHLTEAGHKKIAFVGAVDSEAVSLRYQGYCRALTKARIVLDPNLTVTAFSTSVEGEQAILGAGEAERILRILLEKDITAVFCVNDLSAYMMMQAAKRLGKEVPGELSIVGFDNLKAFSKMETNLTTVAQDFKAIAESCVSTLIDIIENGPHEEPPNIVVPTTFHQGETVAVIQPS